MTTIYFPSTYLSISSGNHKMYLSIGQVANTNTHGLNMQIGIIMPSTGRVLASDSGEAKDDRIDSTSAATQRVLHGLVGNTSIIGAIYASVRNKAIQ